LELSALLETFSSELLWFVDGKTLPADPCVHINRHTSNEVGIALIVIFYLL